MTHLLLANLPVTRTAEIYLKADRPTIKLQVALPDTHPYFLALAQGYMSAGEFVNASFGSFSYSWAVEYTPTLTTQSGIGLVNLEGFWPFPIPEFELTADGAGVSSIPLLSDNDEVTLHFDGTRPAWFDDPLPADLTANTATWRGPTRAGARQYIIKVGLILPEGTVARRPTPAPTNEQTDEEKQQENLRNFLADVESRVTTNFISNTWHALILLIPYVGLLWLARRRTFGRTEVWKPITAAVLILAAWRNWYYFDYLLLAGPGNWLQRVVTPVRYALGLSGSYIQNQLLSDADNNAFWLLFVLFIVLAPLYLHPLEEFSLDWRPRISFGHGSLPRRIWFGVRVIYGLILLALLAFITYLPTWYESHRAIYVQLSRYLSQVWQLDNSLANLIQIVPVVQAIIAVLQTALLVLILLAFSRRAALFGLGLLAVAVRAAAVGIPHLESLDSITGIVTFIRQIPWLVVLIFVVYPKSWTDG